MVMSFIIYSANSHELAELAHLAMRKHKNTHVSSNRLVFHFQHATQVHLLKNDLSKQVIAVVRFIMLSNSTKKTNIYVVKGS